MIFDIDTIALHHALYFFSNRVSGRWERYHDKSEKRGMIEGVGTYEVVRTLADPRRSNPYGDYEEGSTAEGGIVFKIEYTSGPTRYFQQDGTYDSYGEVSYIGGEFYALEPVEQTVAVFRPVKQRLA